MPRLPCHTKVGDPDESNFGHRDRFGILASAFLIVGGQCLGGSLPTNLFPFHKAKSFASGSIVNIVRMSTVFAPPTHIRS
mmetsp:Transcript_6548/g.18723  ORF Transcript_6548/g.18723 Transcript_6548/m.18723 type:complete len:80 (-) Transcript_6548:62-301(-)